MKTTIAIAITLLICAIAAQKIDAQPLEKNNGYALIFPKTGDGFSGNIIRVDRDTVVVYSRDYKYIAKSDIGKIILHTKRESGNGFLIGTLCGTYAANYLFGTADGQPGAFLSASMYGGGYTRQYYSTYSGSVAGVVLLGVIVGGGIGYLVDHPYEEDQTFLFGGRGEDFVNQWSAFEKALSTTRPSYKRPIRLTVSGGSVFANTASAYRDQFENAGYSLQNNYYYGVLYNSVSTSSIPYYGYIQDGSNMNWARSASISYAITDHIEAGVELAWLGEPSFVASTNQDYSNTRVKNYAMVEQRLDTKGYYLIGSYTTQFGKNNDFEALVTAGIGIANIKFDLNGQYETDSSSTVLTSGSDSYNYHKTVLSALVSGTLNYYLYDSFSFGLTANYFFAGSTTAKAMPSLGIKEQPITFGNADIGFTLGLHF